MKIKKIINAASASSFMSSTGITLQTDAFKIHIINTYSVFACYLDCKARRGEIKASEGR